MVVHDKDSDDQSLFHNWKEMDSAIDIDKCHMVADYVHEAMIYLLPII